MDRDDAYTRHILDAIDAVASFLGDVEYDRFTEDLLVQSAVIRQIEIIGEAAGRISEEFRSRHGDVPWRDVIAMRNKLIHEYFGIDIEAVWTTAKRDLPKLKQQLQ